MSLLAPIRRHRGDEATRAGLLRSVRLFRLFLAEQTDPDRFYASLAEDAVRQVAEHAELEGRMVVDVGGGGGWFTAAFRARGANCYLFDPDPAELRLRAGAQAGAVMADGYWLPVRDADADVVFSSNVLEHVPDPARMLAEMIRVTRPGGVVYLAFTNWYSPWGGHEMAPWHYLGAGYAERRYRQRNHKPAKNKPGTGLFPVHVGPTLRGIRSRRDVVVLAALPRYYPRWTRFVLAVPGLREVVTWNLLLVLSPVPAQSDRGPVTVTSGSSAS